eukprot:COSAG06_NODE_38_length_30373_cov_182.543536_6_plen_74_part_00
MQSPDSDASPPKAQTEGSDASSSASTAAGDEKKQKKKKKKKKLKKKGGAEPMEEVDFDSPRNATDEPPQPTAE